MTVRALVLGGRGQLGRALLASAPPRTVGLGREEADLRDPAGLARVLALHDPEVVLNAAAWTAVDSAEEDPEGAEAVNARGVATLARLCAAGGRRLVHVSTDYVFDGVLGRPYRIEDPPHPLNVYGASKRRGEEAVLSILGARGTVVRTSWLYAPWGTNFLLTILRRACAGDPLRVVDDQRGTPTSVFSFAPVLWRLAERDDLGGLWHWANSGETSWCGFARAIVERALARGLVPAPVPVRAITTAEYPRPARRPPRSTLDSSALVERLGFPPLSWEEALDEVLEKIPTERTGTERPSKGGV